MSQRTVSFQRIYGLAAILAVTTLCGLLSALFGDGIWDELSWVAMAVPLVTIAWHYSKGHPTKRRSQ
jgi:hypothetical protein